MILVFGVATDGRQEASEIGIDNSIAGGFLWPIEDSVEKSKAPVMGAVIAS